MENTDTIYLLYTCNAWKEHSSLRVILTTTDKETLFAAVANSIFEGEMEYEGLKNHAGLLRFKEDYDNENIDFSKLSYGFIQAFENENVRETSSVTDISMAYDWLKMDADELHRIMEFGKIEPEAEQDEDEEDLEP